MVSKKRKLVLTAKSILDVVGFSVPGKRVVLDETAIKKAGGMRTKYFEPAPQFGERAYIIRGKKRDVLIWDNGNGWCQILKMNPEVKK